MLLLVIDTSGKHGFVALVRAGEGADLNSVEVIEEVPLTGGTFSALLIPQISALLGKHRQSKSDIGAFVVVSGPGSFTGLRVGLAAIKALAEILQKPIVPVSLLQVVAMASQASGLVVAALDAGRSEVYVGEYELATQRSRMVRERLLTRDEFLLAAEGGVIATPENLLAELGNSAGRRALVIARPDAAIVSRVGWEQLQQGKTVSPEQLEANYIRRTDAEIFAKPASGS